MRPLVKRAWLLELSGNLTPLRGVSGRANRDEDEDDGG